MNSMGSLMTTSQKCHALAEVPRLSSLGCGTCSSIIDVALVRGNARENSRIEREKIIEIAPKARA